MLAEAVGVSGSDVVLEQGRTAGLGRTEQASPSAAVAAAAVVVVAVVDKNDTVAVAGVAAAEAAGGVAVAVVAAAAAAPLHSAWIETPGLDWCGMSAFAGCCSLVDTGPQHSSPDYFLRDSAKQRVVASRKKCFDLSFVSSSLS